METWRGGGGGAGGGRRGWFERAAQAESSSLPCESLAATQTTPRLSVKKGGGDASSGRLTEILRFRSGSDEEMSGALPVLLLLLVRPLAASSPTTSPWAAVIGSAVDLLAARQTARRGKNMKPVEEEKKRNKEQRCFSKHNRKKVKQGAHLACKLSRELSSIDSHRFVLENFHRVSFSAGLRRPAPIRALWGKRGGARTAKGRVKQEVEF